MVGGDGSNLPVLVSMTLLPCATTKAFWRVDSSGGKLVDEPSWWNA